MANVTVRLSDEALRILRYIGKRYADKDGNALSDHDAVLKCVEGFGGRRQALDDHQRKVKVVAKAKKAGRVPPASAKFKRYLPTFKDQTLDASDTAEDIAKWTREAPRAGSLTLGD